MIHNRFSLVRPLLLSALASAACHPASAQLSFTYTSFDPPAPSGGYAAPLANSEARGISNTGAIVGIVGDSSGVTGHGYLYQNGAYTTFDYPGTTTGGFNFLSSINSAGDITGYYFDLGGNETDYIYHNGAFSSPAHPNSPQGNGYNGVNDAGLAALVYFDANDISHSSLYNLATQTFTDLPDESAYGTTVQSVAPNGDILVNYLDAGGDVHGSIYHNGVYTTFDVPGATDTHLDSINADGLIAGRYDINGVNHGLVFQNGRFYTLDFPGAVETDLYSINNANQIVGYYQDQSGVFHSLLVQAVPEPGSVALLIGAGVIGAGFLCRRKAFREAGSA